MQKDIHTQKSTLVNKTKYTQIHLLITMINKNTYASIYTHIPTARKVGRERERYPYTNRQIKT